jgi:protein-disulfide isomerase
MASRKEEKERLRAERLAIEAQQQTADRRRRLVQLGSATVLLAACVVAILIVVSQSGGGGGGGTDIKDVAAIDQQLKGIPQSGITLGEPKAKATVVEFGDLQCPICQAFSVQVAPSVISGPVRSGQAKYEFRQWTILGPDSGTAARAALAAGEQNRYWNFIELFYRNQGTENSGYVTDSFLEALAKAAGVPNIDKWNQSRASSKWDAELNAVDAQASNLGFSGTPSILVEGPGGRQVFGSVPTADQISAAVQAAQ